MKKSLSFLTLLLSITILASCSGAKDKDTNTPTESSQEEAQNNTEQTTDKDSSTASDAQVNEKLNYYVDCINNHSSRALDSYDRYISWADEAAGPAGDEQVIYGLYTLTFEPKECADGIAAAKKLKPAYTELETAAEAYSVALTQLDPLLDEADEYYTEQNYKDDAMAKGKEMHPKLISAFKAFDAADLKMRTELEKIQDELDVKRLAELEKTEGKKYAYLTTNTMVLAKKVWNKSNVVDVKEINLTELQTTIENFEKAVDELKAYHASHKSELPIGVSMETFISQSNDLVTASKELMRRVRDNTAFDTGELAILETGNDWMVEGTPGKVLKAYNSLVSTSNSLSL